MVKNIFLFLTCLALSTPTLSEDIVGDAALGQKLFKRCMACHTPQKGGPNRVGPNLWDVYGSGIAEKESFTRYSPAFLEQKGSLIWDDEKLNAYLENPRTYIPKNRMAFVGLKNPEDRAHVIAYLKTLTDKKIED